MTAPIPTPAEMKACPFCGSPAFLRNLGVHGFEVGCGKCSASGGGSTKAEMALQLWNTRLAAPVSGQESSMAGSVKLERFGFCNGRHPESKKKGDFVCWVDGDYVLYAEHKALVDRLTAELAASHPAEARGASKEGS